MAKKEMTLGAWLDIEISKAPTVTLEGIVIADAITTDKKVVIYFADGREAMFNFYEVYSEKVQIVENIHNL